MNKMTSIVLIDDHPLAINGIGSWLNGTGRFAVSGTAKNPAEAAALMEKLESLPEIVILDISLGPENGLDFIPMLKGICAKRKAAMPGILVCSMYEDPFLVQQAMNLGASGYVPKSSGPEEILTAIEALLEGGVYIPSCMARAPERPWSKLTNRETEIVALIKQNMNSKQIAKRLRINIRTVENHLSHIYLKTGAVSREELFNF
jgi:NarL family two-component system response regulator LiaR